MYSSQGMTQAKRRWSLDQADTVHGNGMPGLRRRAGDSLARLVTSRSTLVVMVLILVLMAPSLDLTLKVTQGSGVTGVASAWDHWMLRLHLATELVTGLMLVGVAAALLVLTRRSVQDGPFYRDGSFYRVSIATDVCAIVC